MRTTALLLIFFCIGATTTFAQKLQVSELTCEYQDNPVGIDVKVPHFSWKLVSSQRDIKQKSYELRVGLDVKALQKGQNVHWQSGVVSSDQSVHVPYAGPALTSRQRYYWQVKISDNTNATSGWSDIKFWE